MSEYTPLQTYLTGLPAGTRNKTMTFEQIENIIRSKLPPSAHNYRPWWANETEGSHLQANSWMEAGWKVEAVDQSAGWVRFVKSSGEVTWQPRPEKMKSFLYFVWMMSLMAAACKVMAEPDVNATVQAAVVATGAATSIMASSPGVGTPPVQTALPASTLTLGPTGLVSGPTATLASSPTIMTTALAHKPVAGCWRGWIDSPTSTGAERHFWVQFEVNPDGLLVKDKVKDVWVAYLEGPKSAGGYFQNARAETADITGNRFTSRAKALKPTGGGGFPPAPPTFYTVVLELEGIFVSPTRLEATFKSTEDDGWHDAGNWTAEPEPCP